MSSHRLYRSSSSPMIAWSSHSPLSRTYSVNDISVYTSASDYFKQRWGTAYNPYHKSQSYYYWPLHRSSRLFPVYSTHEDTRYFYQSPYYTRVPTFYPTCDYSSSANYYTYLLDSFRAVWRRWPYEHGNSYQYRTYWPWRGETRYHHSVNEMTGTHIEYLFEFFYSMSDEDLRTELARENLDTSGNRAQLLGRLRRHYRTALVEIRKRRKGSSKTENFYNYFIVIDFECSCEENNYDFEHEIIEFPACLVSVHSRKIIDQFRTIVRPVKRPKLTEFCQKLTGITQEMVDQAPTFPEALKKFRVWMAKHGLDGIGRSTGGNAKRFCYVTDGPWDIGKFLQMQCIHSGIKVPHDFRLFLNIRRSFVNFYFHPQGHREAAQRKLPNVDLNSMLGHLGMKFEGHQHCGLDDTTNIARIVIRMLQDKAELRVNEKLVLGTKLRRWQKLIFTENAKAPSCHVTPSTSAEEYSAQIEGENVDEFVQNFGQKLSINPNLDENMAKNHRKIEEEGGKTIVWKKWWDLMPYKLVKIGRVDFLGERHLECESCDDFGGSDEEDEHGEEKKK